MIPSTQLLILISMLSCSVSSMDRIEFECRSKNVMDIKYTKNYENQFLSQEYFLPGVDVGWVGGGWVWVWRIGTKANPSALV